MRITFRKRQKEMKRQEKRRIKAEKRAQKKETRRVEKEANIAAPPNLLTSAEPSLKHENTRSIKPGKTGKHRHLASWIEMFSAKTLPCT
jgi:hypothetical protein